MAHGDDRVGERFDRQVRQRGRVLGPGRVRAQHGSAREPYVGACRTGPLREDPRHPRQQILRRVRAAESVGELRQHLVWGRSLPVDEMVGEALHPLAHGLEGDRHDAGRQDRERDVRLSAPADERSDPNHDRDIDTGDERGERTVDDGLVEDDVDVVQAVPQDRDADRDRHGGHGQAGDRVADVGRRGWIAHDLRDERVREDPEADEDAGQDQPPELLALDPVRGPVAEHERRERERDRDAGRRRARSDASRRRGTCRSTRRTRTGSRCRSPPPGSLRGGTRSPRRRSRGRSPRTTRPGASEGLGRWPSGTASGTKLITKAIPAIQIQLPEPVAVALPLAPSSIATAGSAKQRLPAINSQPIAFSGRLEATRAPTVAHAPTNTKAPTVAAALAAPPDSHESDPSIEAPNATRIPTIESAQIPQAKLACGPGPHVEPPVAATGTRPSKIVPAPGSLRIVEGAVEGGEPVGDPLQPRPVRRSTRGSNPPSVVGHGEPERCHRRSRARWWLAWPPRTWPRSAAPRGS